MDKEPDRVHLNKNKEDIFKTPSVSLFLHLFGPLPPHDMSLSIIPPLEETHGTQTYHSFHYNKLHSLEHFLSSVPAYDPRVQVQTPSSHTPSLSFTSPPPSALIPGHLWFSVQKATSSQSFPLS